jgi:hypothetical protein
LQIAVCNPHNFQEDNPFFKFALQSLNVYSPPGVLLGSVEQEWSIFRQNFVIRNVQGDAVLRITGRTRNMKFKIWSSDGTSKVGQISLYSL